MGKKEIKGDLYLLDVSDKLLISNFVSISVHHVEYCTKFEYIDMNNILHPCSPSTNFPESQLQYKAFVTKKLTVHEPSSIRWNVCFLNHKIQVCQDLDHLKEDSMLIDTVNLDKITPSTNKSFERRDYYDEK